MIGLPKLLLIILLAFVGWYATRWFNRPPPPKAVRRQRAGPQRPQAAVEDLTACPTCGTYIARGAGCGKPGCPQPR